MRYFPHRLRNVELNDPESDKFVVLYERETFPSDKSAIKEGSIRHLRGHTKHESAALKKKLKLL